MEEYDFIIIGAGGTGLAAAMYGARLGMRTLCLGASQGTEMSIGGVITTTNLVENYPGFMKISGSELAEKIREHAASYELATIKEEKAESVEKEGAGFKIKTKNAEYFGKTILFATGTKWKKLEVPGGKEFENKGVAYCALCDAPLYRNKIAAVIGGADTAAKDALVLAQYAKKVYLIARNELRAEPINVKRIKENPKIEVMTKTKVLEVKGDKVVKAIVLDKEYNGSNVLEVQGVFVAIGHVALSELAQKLGTTLNKEGEIVIDHRTSETNIPGVYAAGDVADKPFKQAITGVAEGCTAAYSAFEYIKKNSESFGRN